MSGQPAPVDVVEPTLAPRYLGDDVQRHAENEIVRLTNEFRRDHGLPALKISEVLREAAREHCAHMVRRGFFDHVDPDGRTPFDRMRAAGHQLPAAENIARGQRTPQEAMQAWIDSPGHRANLLLAAAKHLGVGARDRYWTQNFGY